MLGAYRREVLLALAVRSMGKFRPLSVTITEWLCHFSRDKLDKQTKSHENNYQATEQ